jgi:hypothetical protein
MGDGDDADAADGKSAEDVGGDQDGCFVHDIDRNVGRALSGLADMD